MTIIDEELNRLSREKQATIKQEDVGFIDSETYLKRVNELDNKMSERLNFLLEQERERLDKKVKEEPKMSEKEQPKKIGKKVQPNSNASVVAEVLMNKSVKNIDEAVAKFDEKKPGRESAKTKSQIKTIIRETKKGKGRWTDYTWDEEQFLLTQNS